MKSWKNMFKDPRLLRYAMNIWPPFLGAGIEVEVLASDFRYVRVVLKSTVFNRNYVGTHFGGSLFAMTDPFYMLMLIRGLGNNYFVWDRSAHIEFIAPGQGPLHCEMRVSEEDLREMREATADGAKYEREFASEVLDSEGLLVARVSKRIYARLKPEFRPTVA